MFPITLERVGKFVESKTEYNKKLLKEYKLHNNFGFPPSYIDFVITYGWGRLCGLFLVYVPLLNEQYPDSWEIRSKVIRGWMNEAYSDDAITAYPFILESDGSIDLVKNAIPFAKSENGDYFIWDVMNPDERGEYPIYTICPRFSGIRYGGKDLAEFISSCGDDIKVQSAMGPGYGKLPLTFEPFKFCGEKGYYI